MVCDGPTCKGKENITFAGEVGEVRWLNCPFQEILEKRGCAYLGPVRTTGGIRYDINQLSLL